MHTSTNISCTDADKVSSIAALRPPRDTDVRLEHHHQNQDGVRMLPSHARIERGSFAANDSTTTADDERKFYEQPWVCFNQ